MNNNENFSIDSILSDIERMRNERGDTDASFPKMSNDSVDEAIQEIDRLLGSDVTSLDGFSDYSEPTPVSEIKEAPPTHPTVKTDRHGQEMFKAVTEPTTTDTFEDIFSDSRSDPENSDWTKIVELVKNGGSSLSDESESPSDLDKTKVIGGIASSTTSAAPSSPKASDNSEMVDGQMILQGFIDEEILAPLDEKEVEEDLKKRSRENLGKFRLYQIADEYEPDIPADRELFDEDEKPGEESYNEEERNSLKEYRHSDQKKNFIKILQEDRRSSFLSACGLIVTEIAMIVLSVLSSKADESAQLIYLGICLLLLSVSAALSVSNLISGFGALFKLKPTCHSASALLLAVTLVHSIVLFIFPDSPGIGGIYCAATGLSLLLSKLSELFKALGILENFKFCAFSHCDELYAVKSIESKAESCEIAKPLMLGEPNLKYSQKIKFPSKFFENSDFTSSIDRMCKITIPAALGLGIISAIAAWIKSKAALGALTAFTASLCISLPAGAAFAIIFPTVIAMMSLNKKGGMIASPTAASEAANAHAVVLDSYELYDANSCGLDGFEDKKTVRIDEVLMYAAALIIGTKGPLSEAFEDIVGNRDILPPVKSLIYEEKLGISGFIHGQSVLLGNRNLLINHSIEAPPKTVEMKHLQKGKRILYIAIGSKVAAMLVLNYIENESLTKPLKVIEKSGISLLVNSVDCNVTDEFIVEGFGMIPGSVKLMSPTSGKLFRSRRNREINSAPAKVLHTGSTESFLHSMAASTVINNIQHFATLAQIIFGAIGWLILFIMLLAGGIEKIGWSFITIYTAVWSLLSTVLGFIQIRKLN